MSHQFKPGDMALVISGNLLGESVEVIDWVNAGEEFNTPDGRKFRLSDKSSTGAYQVLGRDWGALKPPASLMPLRGDFAPEQQKAKEADPCA